MILKTNGLFNKLRRKQGDGDTEGYEKLNAIEKDMIKGIVELSDTTVKEVMLPRIDVIFLAEDSPLENMLDIIVESGFSRFPVYRETIDNVIGILYVKDILKNLVKKEPFVLDKTSRTPYFVPESKRLDSLLREFKRRKVHIAIAVDEYGGVSGIVCLEDIIEEIVGDIQDEFDKEEEDILEVGEDAFLCDARVDIEDLKDETGVVLPDQDFDTLGGFVFDLFGKIPVKFEKVAYKGYSFIIQEMDGQKIRRIKIIKTGGDDSDN